MIDPFRSAVNAFIQHCKSRYIAAELGELSRRWGHGVVWDENWANGAIGAFLSLATRTTPGQRQKVACELFPPGTCRPYDERIAPATEPAPSSSSPSVSSSPPSDARTRDNSRSRERESR